MKLLSLLLVLLALFSPADPAQAAVTLPESTTVIETKAFLNDISLTGELVIPEGVTEIGPQAFKGCTGLTSVTFPATLRSIGSEAFAGCTNLTGYLYPSDDLTIAADALTGSQITILQENPASDFTYTIADGEVTITGYAGEAPIGHLVIPEKIEGYPVTGIGEQAFFVQETLTGLNLPDTITHIDFLAFYGCPNLNGTYFIEGTMHHSGFSESPHAVGYAYSINEDQTVTIKKCSTGQTEGILRIPDYIDNRLVTVLGEESMRFPSDYNFTEIILPTGLKSIGSYCFSGGIETMILPATLEHIPEGAFHACGISNLVLPESITSIGRWAFAFSSIKTINLENVKDFGDSVFLRSSIESVVFPAQVNSINHSMFQECTQLKNVTLPQNITEIPMRMFFGCTALESITLPESVTYLGWTAFADTTSLTSINLDNITQTHNSVFTGSKLLSDAAAKVAAQVVKPGMTDFEKAKALHDWVVNNTTYYLYVAGPEGTFFMDGGSCMSYTQAYGLLLDQVGIENLYIEAPEEMAHIWNLIKLDGEWYHVDCTWDDGGDILTYEYFCLSDELIKKDHSWPYDNYPAANGTRYTNGVDHGE